PLARDAAGEPRPDVIREHPPEGEDEERRDDYVRGEHVRLQRMIDHREFVVALHRVLHHGKDDPRQRRDQDAELKVEHLRARHHLMTWCNASTFLVALTMA